MKIQRSLHVYILPEYTMFTAVYYKETTKKKKKNTALKHEWIKPSTWQLPLFFLHFNISWHTKTAFKESAAWTRPKDI